MKKFLSLLLVCLLSLTTFTFAGCDFFGDDDDVEKFFDECTEISGKWIYYDFLSNQPTNTYIKFDGTKDVMTFEYYVNDVQQRDGHFKVVYRGENKDVATPLSIGFEIKNDSQHSDWIGCYVDDFKTDFSQFTIMSEERELDDSTNGIPQAHIYRMSELPFAFGTYVKENCTLKQNKNNCSYADDYFIPSGQYVNESGAKFTFMATFCSFGNMFRYEYDGNVIEGVYTLSGDNDKFFAYIDYQPGHKPTNAQKEQYEMSSGQDFPPNYNVYGSFEITQNNNFIKIDSFAAIDGFGYDTEKCDWQTGVYNFVE